MSNANTFASNSGSHVQPNGGGGGGVAASSAVASASGSSVDNNGDSNRQASASNRSGAVANGGDAHVNNSGMVTTPSNQQSAGETGKRKKLKTRNAAAPRSGYLAAWLETCSKDATNAQLSSSSEFLDFNPTSASTGSKSANKNIAAHNQQQQQHQTQQQQHSAPASSQTGSQQQYFSHSHSHSHSHSNSPSYSHLHSSPQLQQQQQSQQQQQQQQQQLLPVGMRTNSQMPMPGGHMAPFSQGFQRGMMPSYPKYTHSPFGSRAGLGLGLGLGGVGGMGVGTSGSMSTGMMWQHDNSQDFASLPPIVNIMGGGGGPNDLDNLTTDATLDGNVGGGNQSQNYARGFRFSDPCLLNPSDNDSKLSDQQNTPEQRNSVTNELENNKMFAALMEQINILHETNSKICRNLHETKVDIEALKHAPSWGLRQRRDSLSGLSTHSQPMIFGGGFGTHSPAPTYHSGAYTPGMMTDVVREVKEAARVREDALLNRVKAMVEERQWSMSESTMRLMRDVEELKSQVQALRADKKESNRRLNHLEAENKYMRQMLANLYNNRTIPGIIYENDGLCSRKGAPHARRSHSLNLQYGTVHHQASATTHPVDEQDEPLQIIETPSTTSTVDVACVNATRSMDERSSVSSSDGAGDGVAAAETTQMSTPLHGKSNGIASGPLMSPPSFALVNAPVEGEHRRGNNKAKGNGRGSSMNVNVPNSQEEQQSTQELRAELNEAVAARKEASDRIIALEKLVKNLQVKNAIHPQEAHNLNGDSHSVVGGGLLVCNSVATAAPTSASSTAFKLHNHLHHNHLPHSNNKYHQAQTMASSTMTLSQSSPKVTGPITDL